VDPLDRPGVVQVVRLDEHPGFGPRGHDLLDHSLEGEGRLHIDGDDGASLSPLQHLLEGRRPVLGHRTFVIHQTEGLDLGQGVLLGHPGPCGGPLQGPVVHHDDPVVGSQPEVGLDDGVRPAQDMVEDRKGILRKPRIGTASMGYDQGRGLPVQPEEGVEGLQVLHDDAV